MAAVTHTHLEFKAHQGDGGAFGWTFAAHRLPTFPTVVLRDTVLHVHSQEADPLLLPRKISVPDSTGPSELCRSAFTGRARSGIVKYLSQPDLLAVPHLFEIPEEGLLTLLAGVTVQPFRGLKNSFNSFIKSLRRFTNWGLNEIKCSLKKNYNIDKRVFLFCLDFMDVYILQTWRTNSSMWCTHTHTRTDKLADASVSPLVA